jgi:predicted secreted hydrolase
MNRRRFVAQLLLLPGAAAFASDYPPVVAGRLLRFPEDYGAHADYRVEWWYVTGWVAGADGAPAGLQITFFRSRPQLAEDNPSRFAPRQLLFAHAALADPRVGKLRYDQRAVREGFGLAEAAAGATDVWIDDWSLRLVDRTYVTRIAARDFRFELRFEQTQPVMAQGENGFSRKDRNALIASYYYSEPQLAVSGTIEADGRSTSVRGVAWLDHEWSSEPMANKAAGWDWTGVNFDDGGALMAFRMRARSGGVLWAGGSMRSADGATRHLEPGEIAFEPRRKWRSPRTGTEYPVAMTVRTGAKDFGLEPLMDDQELDARATTGAAYWEGAVRALAAGRELGRGYLELTGYGKPLRL